MMDMQNTSLYIPKLYAIVSKRFKTTKNIIEMKLCKHTKILVKINEFKGACMNGQK